MRSDYWDNPDRIEMSRKANILVWMESGLVGIRAAAFCLQNEKNKDIIEIGQRLSEISAEIKTLDARCRIALGWTSREVEEQML